MRNSRDGLYMNFLLLSGSELAKLIRLREVSAREVIETHINQSIKMNSQINSIVKNRFDAARCEADKIDSIVKEIDPHQLPPFLGVPATIKECFAFAGMPQSCGLMSRKNFIASQNATAVTRYLNAGIIPIGVTNMSELCMWTETYNNIYGRTNNPYNIKHIAGGSSGGEGAIIAAGASPIGLGSDIAGSLRFPAFFNGIFSHKPTPSLVPTTGHFPQYLKKTSRFNCVGPLVRRAEDLYPLLKILKGPDGIDDFCSEKKLIDPKTVDLSQLNIFSIESNGIKIVSHDLLDAQRRVVSYLHSKCANCKTISIDKLKHSFDIFIHTFAKAGGFSAELILKGNGKFNVYLELFKWMIGQSAHIFPLLALVIQERYYATRVNQKFLKLGLELRQEIKEILGDNGVLLYPTYTMTAPKHSRMLFLINDWVYSSIFNVLKMPVTQVPLGLNSKGLPLGLQITSLAGNDHLTLAIALELEKAFGGWVPHSIKR